MVTKLYIVVPNFGGCSVVKLLRVNTCGALDFEVALRSLEDVCTPVLEHD